MISVVEIEEAGITVVNLGERLTLQNASELFHIVKSVPTAFAPNVLVNMEKTTVVDSSGVGSLVKSSKHINGVNGRFAIAALRPEVHRTFQLMNLHQVFDIYETEALARTALTGKRS